MRDLIQSARLGLGAQNISSYRQGAYTGEVSASMVLEFACCYALVGHSERRAEYFESDGMVSAKFAACVESGINPVLCIGETLAERQAGRTEEVVKGQLQAVIDSCGISAFERAVVAYEPVWAIGTGVSASPEEAEAVHSVIRELISSDDGQIGQKIRLLYGGSVNADNAASLFEQENIDGALVGGASLNAEEFIRICQFAGN